MVLKIVLLISALTLVTHSLMYTIVAKILGVGGGVSKALPPPFPYETLTRLPLYIGFVTINRFEPIPQWELENGVEMSHSLLVSLFATEFNISLVPWLICTFHFN